jgi:hypothetical protein
VICDDVTFIASCINEAIGDEIKWPTIEEWITLGLCIYFEFQGYNIRLINGTFIEIKKLWNNDAQKTWFNEHKKMYYINNTVVFDHHE